MTHPKMLAVLEAFPTTPWAKPTSKKYDEALGSLSTFNDVEVADALKSLRRTLFRSHLTTDEIVAEIRRLRRRSDLVAKAEADSLSEAEVRREREDIRRLLLLASREDIAAGVAEARQLGVLSPEPLDPRIEEWTEYARGIVYAAMERQGAFK